MKIIPTYFPVLPKAHRNPWTSMRPGREAAK